MDSNKTSSTDAFARAPGRNRYRITLYTDTSHSWIYPWLSAIKEKITDHHEVRIITDADQIPNGDFNFILGSTKILSRQTLSRNRLNLVVHESDLPRGKGWSPVSWQVLEGKNKIPVALFEAGPDLDSGQVFLRDTIVLEGTELLPEIKRKQGQKTLEMVVEFLNRWPDIAPRPQTGESTFYSKRTAKDDMLDPEKTLAENFDHLRITDNENYPAWFSHRGKRYVLKIYPYEHG